MIFGTTSHSEWVKLHGIFSLFSVATGMIINFEKTVIIPHGISLSQLDLIISLFPARVGTFDSGLKYLGYYIKANNYIVSD